jgi:hypothetical protein
MTNDEEQDGFLGREFLLWLWFCCETRGGLFEIPALGKVGVAFDSMIELRSADGRGKITVRGDTPTRLPEAAVALRAGRWPTLARLIVARDEDTFEVTLQGESLDLSSVKILSDAVHEGQDPREQNEARVRLLIDLTELIDGLYKAFLGHRTAASFHREEFVQIRHWIASRRPELREESAVSAAAV